MREDRTVAICKFLRLRGTRVSVFHLIAKSVAMLALALFSSGSAWATPITIDVDFTASNFQSIFGPEPTQEPVSGSLSLTYDPTVDVTSGQLNYIDLVIGGHSYSTANTGFTYNSTYGRFLIGSEAGGTDAGGPDTLHSVSSGTDDFFWSFRNLGSHSYTSFGFGYATATEPSKTFLADPRLPPSDVVLKVIPKSNSLASVDLSKTQPSLIPTLWPDLISPIVTLIDELTLSREHGYTEVIHFYIEDDDDPFSLQHCTITKEYVGEHQLLPMYECYENSPAWFSFEMDIPNEADTLFLDFELFGDGDGDWITGFFDDTLLFSLPTDMFLTNSLYGIDIPINAFAGQTGVFTMNLNSVGEANAEFRVSNFGFGVNASVPEPSTLLLLGGGLFGLRLANRRRNRKTR